MCIRDRVKANPPNLAKLVDQVNLQRANARNPFNARAEVYLRDDFNDVYTFDPNIPIHRFEKWELDHFVYRTDGLVVLQG